jgi:hypothetical protein
MQRDAGVADGLGNAGGGLAFFAGAGTFGFEGGFKIADVLIDVGERGGREFEANELGLDRRGVGGKGAGGVEQFLVAIMARYVKQAVESGGAEQDEGMGGGVVVQEVAVKFQAQAPPSKLFSGGLSPRRYFFLMP